MSNLKLIPELRFPEFKNEGEWVEKTLEEVAEVNPSSFQLPDVFIYVDLESVENGRLLRKRSILKEGAPSRAQRLLKDKDVIFQMVRPYQKNNYYFKKNDDLNYVASTGYAQLRAFESSMYLYQFIHTDEFVSQVLTKCTGSNYPAINSSDLSKILIQIPKSKEQQKIASCLSSLDDLIAAHSQKLELLKDHKKGLMQNLFPSPEPAEGRKTNLPKYRFKEFEKDGEWVEKKLGDVGDIVTGNTPNTSELSNYGGEKLFVSPADININRYIENTKTKLSELGFSKTRQIPANSVLFVCIGSTIGKVAQNKFVCATNQQINSVIPSNQCSSDFLYSALEKSASIISELAGIQAVPIINKSQFSEVILLFPPTIQEQQKIASCLSSLDALIMAETDKIEQVKVHKKGLMQGLFPKMND